MKKKLCVILPALCVLLLYAGRAGAWKDEKRYKVLGYLETDLRLTLPLKEASGMEDFNFIFSENTFRLKGSFRISKRVKAVVDGKMVFTGMMSGDSFDDLSWREKVDPARFENDALYVQVTNFLLPGLDIRLGRQIIIWGTADMFNPTSNINSLDLEDPLKFGEYIANEIINISYTHPYFLSGENKYFEEFTFHFLVIPLFRPAQIPFWAKNAFTDPDLFRQRVNADEMFELITLQETFADAGGIVEYDLQTQQPDISFKNIQIAMKLEWILFNIDMSISYYRGFDDMLQAERIYADDIHLNEYPAGETETLVDLINSVDVEGSKIFNTITLSYPRMHVIGADFAASLDRLGGLGLWGEIAFFIHPERYYHIRTSGAWAPGLGGREIYIPVDTTQLVQDIEGNWFYKISAGIDYSIFSWWYINLQYMHGFVDEFGMNSLQDYLLLTNDFKFFDDKLLLRAVGMVCIHPGTNNQDDPDDYSFMLYPEVVLSFWRAVDISIGLLYQGGTKTGKFGSALSGPSLVYMKGRVSI